MRDQGGFCYIFKLEIFEQMSHHLLVGVSQQRGRGGRNGQRGGEVDLLSPGSGLLVGEKEV